MGGIYSILNIAKGALSSTQTSLQTTSHNIANVNTKGYARQEALLVEAQPIPMDFGLLGDGVKVQEIIRYYDKYLEAMVARKNTDLGERKTNEKYFEQIEGILDENNSRLSAGITEFFNAWQELSTDPTSVPARLSIVNKGENLARTIRSIYRDLKGLQVELDGTLKKEVADVNRMTAGIADLNQRIFEGGLSQGDANDYINQRTQLVKELSEKTDLVVIENSDGKLTVLTGHGRPLVDGSQHWDLDVYVDQTTGLNQLAWKDDRGNLTDITADTTRGTLGAILTMRDTQIVGFIDQLNEFARVLMTSVNEIHQTGYNLNGSSGVSFFRELTGDYANSIDVTAEVKTDAKNVAATSSLNRPTDNDITLALAALAEADLSFSVGAVTTETTFTKFITTMLGNVGELTSNAKSLTEYQQNTLNMLEKQRESVSGVSLDDEMSNLIKFQYAYQASARLLTVADEMLKTIIEAV
jgi:flagellar hook-associated protein 1 FlgK